MVMAASLLVASIAGAFALQDDDGDGSQEVAAGGSATTTTSEPEGTRPPWPHR